MTAIITLAHQKGGVGKSTLAINTAGVMQASGQRVALVDIDPQGSVFRLHETYKDDHDWRTIPVISRDQFETPQDLLGLLHPYDVAVIDTPPYLSNDLAGVIGISDVIMVPVKPSPLDLMASLDTLALIDQFAPHSVVAAILTMVPPNSGFTAHVRRQLAQAGYQVMSAEIRSRVAYSRSLLLSYLVQGDRRATQEISEMVAELIGLLQKAAKTQKGKK